MSVDNTMAKRSEVHMPRRLWHILSGVTGLIIYFSFNVSPMECVYIAGAVALFGFVLDFKRFKSVKLNNNLYKFFGAIMRESEKESFSGLPFYALGISLSFLFYEEKIAILSSLFLIFADPIASVVGVYFGRDRLFPNKTLQGTLAAFITCLILVICYAILLKAYSPNLIIFAFFSAIFGALSELVSAFNVDDNLAIPVLSGGAISLLNMWFHVF